MQVSEPNETAGYTTQSATHSSCAGSIPTSATTPCFEIDSNSSLYPTAVTETFYDGLGRQVETRAPGPTSGDDTIQFTVYNDSAHTSFTSVPFEVTAGSGWVDPATAKDKNGNTPAGEVLYYDALDRVIAGDDPLFNPPSVPGIWCSSINAYATACTVYKLDSPAGSSTLYETEKDIDPNNHVTETFTDSMGRVADTQEYSGTNGNGLTAIQQISYQDDALGEPTQVTTIDLAPQSGQSVSSVTVTMSYDDLGRMIQFVDPDRGTHAYTYDPDGNVLNDTSGNRTIGYNDDLLGRIGCVQSGTAVSDADGSCTSGTNVQVQNTYDTTEIGTQGSSDFPIGRLTKSQSSTYYPEGGSTQSTEKYQYDQRGRVTTEQLKFALPTSWNLTLPTYQLTELYTDADQPETTQTSTINGQGQNTPQYTESEVYDQTLGVLTGLSSTNNVSTPNLATVGYTINSLLGAINVNSSAGVGSSLATESFSYDGDLRPTEEAATWQSGSGQSGTFFDNAQGYDAASNVDTVTTTISQPNGQSGSDSETQNFCYDEQNRLVWAGNSGTQPSPGNGTCGSGTLSNNFSGASYATSFSYTNLGQLWQGPLNGTGSGEQYLYCNSQPHQVSDIVPAGQGYSCSNLPSSIPYAVTYDAWGNVTSRSYNTQTATLSYNKLDEMVEWQVPNTNQAWYAYDANGERTLERSTTGSTTTETVYAFGLEEYSYDSSGNQTSSTHYYSLAGHLIGEQQTSGTNATTNFFLTDALGSVLAVISNTQNSATLLSNQVFAPYGKPLSQNGNTFSQYTNKGFTGQYNDPTSGLDYYVSRYYDPVSGVFLSADQTLGDAMGMNPYSYVGNNPETNNDPTGQAYIPPGGGGNGGNGNGNNNNGNGNNGGGGGSGGGGGCGLWNLWCWTWGGGSGNSSLKVLADSLPFGLGGEASQIQGPEGMDGILDGQMAEVDAQLTEDGELQTLEAEVPQLVNDPGDALQAAETSEQGVETFKGDIAQEEVAQDVKEYGEPKPVTTDTTTTTNTAPLGPNAEQHIFEGDVKSGKAGGYHWEGDPNAPGQVVPGTSTPPDARGVYEAQVTVNGVPKIANGGYSSFFPSWMTRQDVLDAINEGYNNRLFMQGNEYAGETSTGIVVGMYINVATGGIISAFPWYEPGIP